MSTRGRRPKELERRLGVPAGAEVLDVPCGAGRLALRLAERGAHVTGVDLSAESLAHARAAERRTDVAAGSTATCATFRGRAASMRRSDR